jgi:hypothetical protein
MAFGTSATIAELSRKVVTVDIRASAVGAGEPALFIASKTLWLAPLLFTLFNAAPDVSKREGLPSMAAIIAPSGKPILSMLTTSLFVRDVVLRCAKPASPKESKHSKRAQTVVFLSMETSG